MPFFAQNMPLFNMIGVYVPNLDKPGAYPEEYQPLKRLLLEHSGTPWEGTGFGTSPLHVDGGGRLKTCRSGDQLLQDLLFHGISATHLAAGCGLLGKDQEVICHSGVVVLSHSQLATAKGTCD